MPEEKISRRNYLKYAGVAVAAAAVGAAGLYATSPPAGPGPTVTQTLIETLQATTAAPQTTAPAGPPMTKPKKKYTIAFSNGEMVDPWRWTFVKDMEAWAKKYNDIGPGVNFIWTNALQDSAKQLADCETLLAMKPDVLILSPYESAPLDPVFDKCNDAGVPLFCIDREILRTPGTGTYVQAITQDWYYNGRLDAMLLVEKLKAINGEPKGNCVWIMGAIGSSPQIGLNVGVADYLLHMNNYTDVKFYEARPGNWDAALATTISEDFYTKYGKGQIDFVFTNGSIMALSAMEVAKRFGRDELIGKASGDDCYRPWLEMIVAGEGSWSAECSPYYGYITLEEVMKYLNGEKAPPYKAVPIRTYSNWIQPDIVKKHVEVLKEQNLDYPTFELDNFDELVLEGVYGKPDWWNVSDPTPMPNVIQT